MDNHKVDKISHFMKWYFQQHNVLFRGQDILAKQTEIE